MTSFEMPITRNSNWHLYALFVVFGIFFFAEVLNTFYVKSESREPSKFSTYSKIVFEGIFCLYFLLRKKIAHSSYKLLAAFIILTFLPCLGNYMFFSSNPDFRIGNWGMRVSQSPFSISFFFVNQCLFMFLYFCFFKTCFEKISYSKKKYVFKLYECIILFYGLSAIIGFIFGINICKTYYPLFDRWGYNGLLPYTNASSGFWLIALFYSLVVFVEEKRKSLLFISLAAMFLAGAKSLWLLTFAIMGIFIWKFYSRNSKIIIFALFLVLLGVALMALPYMLSILRGKIDTIDAIIFAIEHGEDLLLVLSSHRFNIDGDSGRITNLLDIFSSLGFFNYLFGGLGGIIIIEMAFIDIPFAFGIIGVFIYMKTYLFIFSNIKESFRVYFTSFYFVTALLIGWLFNTPSLAPYLTVFILRSCHKFTKKELT